MFIGPWGSVTVFPCGNFDCLWLLSCKVTTWELPAVSPLPPTQASSVAADLTKQNAPQTGTRIPWSAILILYLKFDSPNTSSQDIIYWLYTAPQHGKACFPFNVATDHEELSFTSRFSCNLHCLMKNSKDRLKCCEKNLVNLTVAVQYSQKSYHPPQYYGIQSTYFQWKNKKVQWTAIAFESAQPWRRYRQAINDEAYVPFSTLPNSHQLPSYFPTAIYILCVHSTFRQREPLSSPTNFSCCN